MLELLLPPLQAVCSLNIAAFFFFFLSPRCQTMQGRSCIAAVILMTLHLWSQIP